MKGIAIAPMSLLLLLLLVGCQEARTIPDGIVLADSTGIQFVSVVWEEIPVTMQMDSVPFRGFGDEVQNPLFDVQDATLLVDGTLVIAEGSTQELVWVDASGSVTRSGGEGDGPEEFRGLDRLFAEPEVRRVVVFDSERRREVVVSHQGSLIASTGFSEFEGGTPHLVVDGEGSRYLLLKAGVPSDWVEGRSRGEGPLIRLGEEPDTLTRLPGSEVFMISEPSAYGPVPLGADLLVAPAPTGVWVGDTSEQKVSLWHLDETPATVIQWDSDDDRSMNPSLQQVYVESSLEDVPGELKDQARSFIEAIPLPDTLPAFMGLLAEAGGALWIGRPASSRAAVDSDAPDLEWLRADISGVRCGRIVTPGWFRPTDAGRDWIVGVSTAENGVERVEVYRLSPAS